MGNINKSFQYKISFEDMQIIIQQHQQQQHQQQHQQQQQQPPLIILNTLPDNEQLCLIIGTIPADKEVITITQLLEKKTINTRIIIYGKNCNDESVIKKITQLHKLGFLQVYIYVGGLFEWICLQDIYGKNEFPTTTQENDILKFKPIRQFAGPYKMITF